MKQIVEYGVAGMATVPWAWTNEADMEQMNRNGERLAIRSMMERIGEQMEVGKEYRLTVNRVDEQETEFGNKRVRYRLTCEEMEQEDEK